jgi:hypothetical protein
MRESSSDRSFGIVFAIFFALLGAWPLVHHHPARPWAFYLSAAFLLLALIAPRILHPLNLLWTRVGQLLGKITNPIVTGLMFYLVFTPAALLLRAFGKDLLRLKFDPAASSYWIPREPPGPAPETMKNQF